ncbi:MAG: arylamine N-acetyltransferase [Solirubrobacteraceae bacterium]|nr:arylamine N-acetyltransferase [Solirubrobacteraceae bacterium]
MPDLDALLARIGLPSAPPATLEGLRAIHRAYLSAIPYDDLAVQLGEAGRLDVDALAARLLAPGGRGGYCFELNGVLAWLLERVGFAVERHESVVGPRDPEAPVNHLALVVRVDGEPWLVDAGLGEGPAEIIPLAPGTYLSPLSWTVARDPGGGWWLTPHRWSSLPGVWVDEPVVGLEAFQPHHHRLATSPESKFVRTLVVQRAYPDRIVTLRSRTLRTDGPGVSEQRVLEDRADLEAVLDGVFGIDPAALGPQRLERLWARIVAQHRAWQAEQAAAADAVPVR